MNKTATSSSHQDSEYDTASDSQSSDEADLLRKREPISHSSNLPIPFSKKNTFYFVFCSLKSICFLSILKHIMTMVISLCKSACGIAEQENVMQM